MDPWDAWTSQAETAVWAAWAAWEVREAWETRTWDAWAARDARDALILQYASLRGEIQHDPNYLTVGIIDAYRNGLGVAIPTDKNQLGWAMEKQV